MSEICSPKMVYKNLEDIIRARSLGSSRRNVHKQKKQSQETIKTQKSWATEKHKSRSLNSSQASRHSLKSTEKIKISDIHATGKKTSKELGKEFSKQQQFGKIDSRNFNLFLKKQRQSEQSPKERAINQFEFYHQIDALFIDFEDYLRELKEEMCQRVVYSNQEKICQTLEMIRYEFQKLKCKLSKSSDSLSQRDTPKYNKSKVQAKQKVFSTTQTLKRSKENESFADIKTKTLDLEDISEVFKRQNTALSTIQNCCDESCNFTPTETDDELLNLLSKQNKIANSNKRKKDHGFEGSSSDFMKKLEQKISHKNLNGRRALNDINLGGNTANEEYSFRHKKLSASKQNALNGQSRSLKSKENREKTVYEIVLAEKHQKRVKR